MQTSVSPIKSVTVVGLGNTGSHAAPHVARMPAVARLTIIDRDIYAAKNVESQHILQSDIGKPKAFAQARRLREIRPDLVVEAISDDVRNVPIGRLRANVILACLDSRVGRQYVNEVAWRLGVPWIDSGVCADGLLARVNVYAPTGGPCLECGWGDKDYEALEQTYPCHQDAAAAPTDAPSSLGALAASLQAIECGKILDGRLDLAAVGRQILIDASTHKYYVSSFRRNERCRFDHEVWDVQKLDCDPRSLTLAGLFETAAGAGDHGMPTLVVDGKAFARAVSCPDCGRARKVLGLVDRLAPRRVACVCGRRMIAGGLDLVRRLDPACLTARELRLPLGRLGLCAGDVVTIRFPERDLHYEL